jgi:hypothetical protein
MYEIIAEYYRRNNVEKARNICKVVELIAAWINFEDAFKDENKADTLKQIEKDPFGWCYANRRAYTWFENSMQDVCYFTGCEMPEIIQGGVK